MTNFEMVKEFCRKHGHTVPRKPMKLTTQDKFLRIRLMVEELSELITSMQKDDLVGVSDAVADMLYVVYGVGVNYGLPMDEVFKEVHRSNMTKETRLDEGRKVVKGPEFDPPKLEDILGLDKYDDEWYCNVPKE